MLTRARAKAANQPIFVDEQWNDAYIHNKDEQIDAMHAERVRDSGSGGWSDHDNEDSDDSSDDDDDDPDADVWRSDNDASSDSDDDEEGDGGASRSGEADTAAAAGVPHPTSSSLLAGGGFLENVFWTALTLLVVPMFAYAAVLKRNATPWPLQSASFGGTLVKVCANVLSLTALSCVAYSVACVEHAPTSLPALLWRNLELNSVGDCRAALRSGYESCLPLDVARVSPQCARAVAQSCALAVLALFACCFHRRWLKTLLLLTFATYAALNVALELQAEQRLAVRIASLDPPFAFVNESIFVAVDGQNLAQGGVIAWAPYWGGLDERKAHKVVKRFPVPLRNGGVLVTFDAVNDYVPCYAAAVDPRATPTEAAAAFRCFDAIRLRVKDVKSVPGWSLQGGGTTADSDDVDAAGARRRTKSDEL